MQNFEQARDKLRLVLASRSSLVTPLLEEWARFRLIAILSNQGQYRDAAAEWRKLGDTSAKFVNLSTLSSWAVTTRCSRRSRGGPRIRSRS